MNKLLQLKQLSTVVADSGDMQAIQVYKPEDATTNPSLLLKASQLPQYQPLMLEAQQYAQKNTSSHLQKGLATDKLATLIGKEILQCIAGRVSTEVDARLSFDTAATIEKARFLINLYEELEVDKSRILIKIASTWEGIQAAKVLEREGINCNLTLLFSDTQAQACADAGVTLISPFVGRISDWYKVDSKASNYQADNDPGVQSVKSIYNLYKEQNYQTIIMGASFRSTAQIEALAGCDRLTISPALLEELQNDDGELTPQLNKLSTSTSIKAADITQSEWRFAINQNAMATEKLAEGIRLFAADQITLEDSFHTNLVVANS